MAKTTRVSKRAPTRRGVAVEPVNVMRMYELIGTQRTADALGTTTATVHRARRNNAVSKWAEAAAANWLALHQDEVEETETPARPVVPYSAPVRAVAAPAARNEIVLVVEVPDDKAETVRKVVASLGGQVVD